MYLADLISMDRIDCNVDATSKKRALERLSELISRNNSNITSLDVFNSMLARERKGSTGFGHGVAIPHGRLKNTTQALGAFIKLKQGIDFDAIDRQPVDLLFALLVPDSADDEHVKLLSQLAQMFRDETMREKLRHAHSVEDLHLLFVDWQKNH